MLTKLINKSTYYLFLITILERLTFFCFYLVLARLLSVEKYGLIITVFAFVNIISPFLELGLPFFIQREIARNNRIQDTFNSALTLKIIVLPIYFLLPLIYFNSLLLADLFLLLLIPLIPYLINFNLLLQSIFYGKADFKRPLLATLISRIFFFTLTTLFYILDFSVVFFLLLMITVLTIQLIALGSKLRDLLSAFKFTWDLSILQKTILNSFPIGVGLIFITFSDRIDILILEKLINFNSVAYYAVAYTIFRNLQIISTTLLIPEYTIISARYQTDKKIVKDKFNYYFKYLTIISLSLILFFYYWSDPLLVFFFSAKYTFSTPYLQLLVLALPGVFWNHLTGIICNATLNSKIPAYSTGFGTLINIIVNFITIPVWGIFGAVLATIITEYFIFIFQFIFLIRNRILNYERA